jgi:hypothetical protein
MNWENIKESPILHNFFSFSILVFVLNAFVIHPKINRALYLLNILSFIGSLIMTYSFPFFLYNKFKIYPFVQNMNIDLFNIINVGYHIIPIYLFSHRNSLKDVFSIENIFISAFFIILYLLLFYNNLKNTYPLHINELFIMTSSIYTGFILIHLLYTL